MMFLRLIALVVVGLGVHMSPAMSQQQTEDRLSSVSEEWDDGLGLPIMTGLSEVPNTRVEFDKPEGKIVNVVYWTEGTPWYQVLMFYMKAAPQLGWRPIPVPQWPVSFMRNGEILTIGQDHKISEKEQENKGLFVPFSIRPEKK